MRTPKRIISLVLALCLILPFANITFAKDKGEPVEGNLIRIRTLEDFEKGTLTNVEASASEVSDGAVCLAEGQTDGEFVSQIFAVQPFEYMVASWNADVPAGTYVEVKARAYVDMANSWTEWLSWGKWTKDITKRRCTDDKTDLAGVNTDVFTVYGSNGETASLVQIKVELHTDDAAVTPVLEQVAVTYRNTLEGQAIPVTQTESLYDGELPEKVEPTAPAISQMVREPSIGNVICSATTICTILNAHGEDLLPEQVALLNYDSKYDGFGNWAFSVAAAGSFGYDAYIQYADFDVLRNELANGNPVGLSVHYSTSQNGGHPYLENGAISSTGGHLITITGYETVDGVEYFYSSDAAAGSDVSCLRRYRADQLDGAWDGRIAYIVHEKQNPTFDPIEVIEAELVPVEGVDHAYRLDTDAITMDNSFRSGKLSRMGAGIACLTIEGQNQLSDADKLPVVLKANQVFKYSVNYNGDGTLGFDPNRMMSAAQPGETWTYRLYVMTNDGKYAEATVDVTKPAEEADAADEPEATPEATEPETTPEAAPEAPDAPTVTEPEGSGINGAAVGAIAAAVIVAIAAVAFVVLRKKK